MTERSVLRGLWRVAYRSSRTDEGFTLLELVAALTILATGIVGVMSVTNSSIGVATTTSARSKAVALATHKIEEFRARPYDALEVKPACAPPAVPVPPAPPASPTCYPMEQHTVGGRSYVVESAVDWADADATYPDAYKAAYVIVSWSDATYHEVRQDTTIYPGGRGPYVAAPPAPAPSTGGTPEPPTLLTATNVALSGVIAVDLTWVPPLASDPVVASYRVEYSTDSFATSAFTLATSDATPYFRVTDLAAGTTYQFRVYAVGPGGEVSTVATNTAAVTTNIDPLAACRVGVVSVSPLAVYKGGGPLGSKLKTNPVVAVSTAGDCTLTTLVAHYSPNASTALTTGLTRNGSVYSGLLDGNQDWEVGRHQIVIRDLSGEMRASTHMLVCEPSKKACR